MPPLLLFVLALVLIAVGAIPLVRQRLRTEGIAWRDQLVSDALYDAVSGKVLVRNVGGYDIYPSGVVPEGAVVVLDTSPEEIYGRLRARIEKSAFETPYEGEDDYFRHRAQHLAMPSIYQPRHVFINGAN